MAATFNILIIFRGGDLPAIFFTSVGYNSNIPNYNYIDQNTYIEDD